MLDSLDWLAVGRRIMRMGAHGVGPNYPIKIIGFLPFFLPIFSLSASVLVSKYRF